MTTEFAPHPGDVIKQILRDLNVTHYRLARDIGETPVSVNRVLKRKTHLSAIMAIKIGKAINMSPEALLSMQNYHDISRNINKVNIDQIPSYPLKEKDRNRSE